MRFLVLGIVGAVTIAAVPAGTDAAIKPIGKIILFDASNARPGSEPPTIARGEQFGVACGCLGDRGDVRVVLAIDDEHDEKPLGFKKVLVTDEKKDHGGLRVRVPDAPSLANH